MGYYIRTDYTNVFIAKKHFDDLYVALCALNDHDEWKRGGSMGSTEPRPEGLDHHPDRWFSWMPADYPKHYATAIEILQATGFDVVLDDDGNISDLCYDSKSGWQDTVLFGCAPFMADGSEITFIGEDDTYTRFSFKGGQMFIQDGVPQVQWGEKFVYAPFDYLKQDLAMRRFIEAVKKEDVL